MGKSWRCACIWAGQRILHLLQDLFNPWCRQVLATCYQLAQSVLKIGSVLAERLTVDGGGCSCL